MTIAKRPSQWDGMAGVVNVIWGKWEQKYFSENQKKDSTALSTNRPTGKSLEPILLSAAVDPMGWQVGQEVS